MSDDTHSQPSTRALLVGATGPMGRAVLRHADPRAIGVRALARTPQALAGEWDDVVRGDVRDRESLARALDGVDTVINVLGSKPFTADAKDLLETGTRNLMDAMAEGRCRRLITVTGMGAGSSRGHGPWYYDLIVRPTVLKTIYDDKDRQEAAIEASGLEWTIVRPSMLVKQTPAKPIKSNATLGEREKMGPISRDDVARFLLAEAVQPARVGEIVHLYT